VVSGEPWSWPCPTPWLPADHHCRSAQKSWKGGAPNLWNLDGPLWRRKGIRSADRDSRRRRGSGDYRLDAAWMGSRRRNSRQLPNFISFPSFRRASRIVIAARELRVEEKRDWGSRKKKCFFSGTGSERRNKTKQKADSSCHCPRTQQLWVGKLGTPGSLPG
jgi:hypothetical protein